MGTDDEEVIMKSVGYVDAMVQDETDHKNEPGRFVRSDFSIGCAVAIIRGLVSESRWEKKDCRHY